MKESLLLVLITIFFISCSSELEFELETVAKTKDLKQLEEFKNKLGSRDFVDDYDREELAKVTRLTEKTIEETVEWYDSQEFIEFIDPRDNKSYSTILLRDGKTWFAENLNFKTEKSWCYNDQNRLCETNGGLYLWEDAKKACPGGWRLPSDDEWWNMISY